MKKSVAIFTSFLLLFSVLDSVSMLPSVQAATQTPATETVAESADAIGNREAFVSEKTPQEENESFFYDVPLPESIHQYIPGDIRNHWASTYLLHFVYSDILKGYKIDKTRYEIKPNHPITRAEFVTLLVRALGLKADGNTGKSFVDVPRDQYFYEYVSIASAKGIVKGVDATHFAPNRYVQRDEMAVMIIRAFKGTLDQSGPLKTFKDVPAYYWAKPEIDMAVKAKIITGYEDQRFLPKNFATRAEGAKMLFTALIAQKSNLPSNQQLMDTVIHMEQKLYKALLANDFNEAKKIYNQYTIGYNRVMGNHRISNYEEIVKRGYRLYFFIIGEYKVDVLAKSNGIATIHINHATQHIIKMKDGTEMGHWQEKLNNILYLKKMPDGQWKIYYNMPDVSEKMIQDSKSYLAL